MLVLGFIYVDDTVVVVDGPECLEVAVHEWSEGLKRRGLSINSHKSKVMHIRVNCFDQILEVVETLIVKPEHYHK